MIRAGIGRGARADGGGTAPERAAWGRGAALPDTQPTLNFPITRRGKGVYRVACIEPVLGFIEREIRIRGWHLPHRQVSHPLTES